MSNAAILDNTSGSNLGVGDNLQNSRILWDNLLIGATVTSANDSANIPNLYDYMTTTFWNAGSGSVDLLVTLPLAADIDCAGVAAGNWAEAGTVIEVYSDNGTTKVGELSGLKDNQPHLFTFDSVFTNTILFRFISTGNLFVGQVGAGECMNIPACPTLGTMLGQFNNDDKVISQKTENNAFGSNSVVPRSRETMVPYTVIPISWVYDEWTNFSDEHKGKPIWFGWDTKNNPLDITFGHWSTNKLSYSKSTFTDLTLTVKGQT